MQRARSSVDVGRLSAAASRPGIDPRVWLTLAVVDVIGFDPENGIFADITYQPDGTKETALVGSAYAGDEFGFYCPVAVGDTVLVAVAGGDPGNGPVIVSRMWGGPDKPNAELQSSADPEDATQDVVLRVRPGQKFKIRTSGANDGVDIAVEGDGGYNIDVQGTGNITLNVNGGVVQLAGTTLTPIDGVVTGQAIDTFTGATQFVLGNASSKVLANKG